MADLSEKPTENVEEKTVNTAESEELTDTEKSNGTKTSDDAAKTGGNGASVNEEKPTDVESKILRQVEYYFGDVNIIKDKFLVEKIKKDEEGWVPLDVVMTFNRLAALSKDADEIINALLKSETGVFQLSEDRSKIRRHPERPWPEANEERRLELLSRTAYAKGFPLDATIHELLEFFESFHKVENLNMRKYFDKPIEKFKFKGSVNVIFEKIEQAEKFINQPEVLYKGKPIERKWQKEHNDKKQAERLQKNKEKNKKVEKKEEKEIVLNKGTVLHFEGADDESRREDIRDAIEKIDEESKIAYIDYKKGQKEGKIRFHDEGQAVKFLEKLQDKKLPIKEGLELALRTLAEEEEEEFLKQVLYKGKPIERKWQKDHSDKKQAERQQKNKEKNKKVEKKEKKEIVLNKGTVLHFEGVDDESRREDIRDAIEKIDEESKIAYIDYKKGQKEGKIRFHDEGQADKFLEKLQDKKLPIKEGLELALRTLAEEEEEEFLKQVVNSMKNIRIKPNKFAKNNNRKRRGNFQNRRGKRQKLGNDD